MADRPLLLLVNDDGIGSPGLAALAAALRPLGEVVVFAPAAEMSGVSHHLTIWDPVRTRPAALTDGSPVTAVDGTPADCVKVAILAALPRRPDAVLSGVNRGLNVGVNLFYSGTVAAAFEAAILRVPAAAISLDARGIDDFHPAAAIGARVAAALLARAVPPGTILNVNVPPLPLARLTDVRCTRVSDAVWEERYEVTPDPGDPERGRMYQMTGTLAREGYSADSDVGALREDAVSITPLRAAFALDGTGVDAGAVLARVRGLDDVGGR